MAVLHSALGCWPPRCPELSVGTGQRNDSRKTQTHTDVMGRARGRQAQAPEGLVPCGIRAAPVSQGLGKALVSVKSSRILAPTRLCGCRSWSLGRTGMGAQSFPMSCVAFSETTSPTAVSGTQRSFQRKQLSLYKVIRCLRIKQPILPKKCGKAERRGKCKILFPPFFFKKCMKANQTAQCRIHTSEKCLN